MKQLAKQMYRSILPLVLRQQFRTIRYNYDLKNLRKKIIQYYSKLPHEKVTIEQLEVLQYLKDNKASNFPYNYKFNYKPEDIKVYRDTELNLYYVLFDEKRLYFKRSWTEDMVKYNYNLLLIEQDKKSPHLYLTDDFFLNNDSVVADIGVAEGNFSLSVVEKAKQIYLFETNPEWIEALEATFAPWKEKIKVINKFVSNINDDNNVSLDSFFMGKEKIDFLKIDVDGAEEEVLKGCENILKGEWPLKIALCTYHRQEDEKLFSALLKADGFDISLSSGYMIFFNHGFNLKPPYLTRGLIRATR